MQPAIVQKISALFRLLIPLGIIVLTSCSKNKTSVIGLQPFEKFDPAMSDTIANTLQKTYGFKTVVLKPIAMPSEAFVNIKTPRYRADFLIKFLKDQKADSIDYVLGLTHQDISITKKDKQGNVKLPKEKYSDWGIMGLGYTPGPSCILSTYRLTHNNKEVYMDRMKKISIHELGHNLGLKHCAIPNCVMQDAAETIKTIDRVSARLCSVCIDKLDISK